MSKSKNKRIILFRKSIFPLKPIFLPAEPRNSPERHLEETGVHQNQQEAFLIFGGVGIRKININGSLYSYIIFCHFS
jgi:hypothetical protein